MNPIRFKTISHGEHRYSTFGDYWEYDDTIEVRVSKTKDIYEAACFIHECVELLLLKHRGIPLSQTDVFDVMFEGEREDGKHSDEAEPGDDPRAIYRREHRFAENIERLFLAEAGIEWDDYSAAVNKLFK
jgi:hypothetical protein